MRASTRTLVLLTAFTGFGLTAGVALAQPMPGMTPPDAVAPLPPGGPAAGAPAQPGTMMFNRAAAAPGAGAPGQGRAAMAMTILQGMDADNDGKVTAAEFQAGWEAMFARMDANGDGAIDATDRPAIAERAAGDAPAVGGGAAAPGAMAAPEGAVGPRGGAAGRGVPPAGVVGGPGGGPVFQFFIAPGAMGPGAPVFQFFIGTDGPGAMGGPMQMQRRGGQRGDDNFDRRR